MNFVGTGILPLDLKSNFIDSGYSLLYAVVLTLSYSVFIRQRILSLTDCIFWSSELLQEQVLMLFAISGTLIQKSTSIMASFSDMWGHLIFFSYLCHLSKCTSLIPIYINR